MDYLHQIHELSSKAYALPHSDTQVMLMEEAIRLADTHTDTEAGFYTRKDLMEAAIFSGYPLKALVAFSWCIAQCDKDPKKYEIESLLWEYKWIIDSIDDFPQISSEKIEELLEDMKKRYQQCGYNLRPYFKLRWTIAINAGEKEKAIKYRQRMAEFKRDSMSDCLACEMDEDIRYLIFLGQYDEALQAALPIIQGKSKCGEVPHITFANLLIPLYKLDRLEQANELQKKGYSKIHRNRDFTKQMGEHILFLTLTDMSKALDIFQKHLSWTLSSSRPGEQFSYYRASWIMMEKLLKKGPTSIKLLLPSDFSLYQKDGNYEVSILKDWFALQTQAIAEQFNTRNKNKFYNELIKQGLEYAEDKFFP